MKKFFQIMKDEIKLFWHEPGAKLIMIIGVFAYSVFYAIPYHSEIVRNIPIGIVNNDNTALSRTLIRNLDATDSLTVIRQDLSIEDAKKEFYKDNIRAFIVIPDNFEKDILRGKPANISFYGDSSYLIIYKGVYSAVVQVTEAMGTQIEINQNMKKGMSKQLAILKKQPFEYIPVALYNPQGGYATYMYPVVVILVLHQTLIVGLGLMQGTRNEKDLPYKKEEDNLAVTLLARTTTYVILYMVYAYFLFLLFPAIINYPMSYNILGLIAILVPLFYSAAFFSFSISYFFKQRESALLIMVVMSLLFVFFTGIIWPKESIPEIINLIADFIPATIAVDSLIKLNQMNGGFWVIRYNFLWLIFLNILYFMIALKSVTTNYNNDNKE